MHPGPQPHHDAGEIIRLEHVWLDPVMCGFGGVMVELAEQGGLFTLLEVATTTGNRILKVTSRDEAYIKVLFERELAAYARLQSPFETHPKSSAGSAGSGGRPARKGTR